MEDEEKQATTTTTTSSDDHGKSTTTARRSPAIESSDLIAIAATKAQANPGRKDVLLFDDDDL